MKAPFPTFSITGPILSLDDEAIFHRLLARVLPSDWDVKFFTDQSVFSSEIARQVALQDEMCRDLGRLIKSSRDDGTSLVYEVARYWSKRSEMPATVAMIDFRMPYATGVELLSRAPLSDWTGGKLLMTAHADDSVAVDAFNRSLISQFVSKGLLGDSPETVIDLIDLMRRYGNHRIEMTWASQVEHEQLDALNACRSGIESLIRENGWTEYAVIGSPFGIVGRDKQGKVKWLQLETDNTLFALCEVLESMAVSKEKVQGVRERSILFAPEIELPNFADSESAGIEFSSDRTRLLGGLFNIELGE